MARREKPAKTRGTTGEKKGGGPAWNGSVERSIRRSQVMKSAKGRKPENKSDQ
jgi:hypothetical protein